MATRSDSTTCPPRWSSPRRPDRPTWGPDVAKVARALGKPLMPWQQHVLDVALEVNPDTGRLAYREVRLTVPRQSGKTTLILAKNVHRMLRATAFGGRQRLLYTAQTRKKAREKFVDDYIEELKTAKALRGRWRDQLGYGSESIRWSNGSIWGIESNTEKAGHGGTLDVGDIDEAFAQVDSRLEQAMKPAMITRPQPQLWVVSTAGTEMSLYLKDKVDAGRVFAEDGKDTGVAYFEWSADREADPFDPATWWACMPALGHTVTEDAVQADLDGGMSKADFCRAYLNWWMPRVADDQIIPPLEWLACADATSRITGPKVWAIDVSPNGSRASIAVAGPRADGRTHFELVDNEPDSGWTVPRIADLISSHQTARIKVGEHQWRTGVLIDPTGPAGELVPRLKAAGLDPYLVTTRDMGQACGGLQVGVRERTVAHLGQDHLRDALNGASRRDVGDGAWAFARKRSDLDITPIVAAALALHGQRMTEAVPEQAFLAAWR